MLTLTITKKIDGLLVTREHDGRSEFMSFWEGIIYRLTARIPDRFFAD